MIELTDKSVHIRRSISSSVCHNRKKKKHVQDIENKDQLKYMTLEIRIR